MVMPGHMAYPPTPFIGRQGELASLRQVLLLSREAGPRVVMVTGEPGIGKTRLLDELAASAAREELTVLRGSTSQAENMPPYLPFLGALGEYILGAPIHALRTAVGTRGAILATLFPEIPERLGPPDRMHPLPKEQERFRLFEAVALFLAAIAEQRGLVLVLDDLQWADAATCALLLYVSTRVRSVPLVITGAYRDGEVIENPSLLRTLAELNRLRLLLTVPLQPLGPEECKALAAAALGGKIGDNVGTTLHQRSEGNPFFLEELARALVEDGALGREHGQWELQTSARRLLPPGLAETIRMRLSLLDPRIEDVLRIAAVVGRRGEAVLLARIAGVEPEHIEELLRAAARAHLVRLEQDGSYAFVHDVVRETLYADVGRERRRQLHRAIGSALAVRPSGDSPARSADLAFHFAESEERRSALRYALAAGQEALQMFAAVEAMAYYRIAARLAGVDQSPNRSAALMGLGEAATLAGEYLQAADAYAAAGEEWQRAGNSPEAARAFHELGRVRWRQESASDAKRAFERALALAGLEDSQEGAETLLQLADLHVTSLASYAGGTAYAERALAMVERLGDKGLKARALCVLGNIKARSNNPAAGTAELERSRALAEQIDEPALAAEACAYLANVYAWTGNLVRSRDLTLQRLQLAERTHDPFEFRHVYSWLGVLETLQGRWSEADAWFARQERALAGLQTPEPLATLRAGQGLLHYYLGQFDRAERAYRETIALLQPINPGSLVWYLGRLALVLIEMEAREEAVNCLAELQELAAPLPEQASARLCALTYLAVSYTRLGLRNEAAACLPGLLPFRGQFAPIPVERALGLAAMSADKTADARRYLAHAETRAREAGMTPELALILLERGHLDRGRRPVAATVEGLDLCEQLGMRELGQRFTGTTIGAQGAGLTRRELDVLRLVAEGQSNREIADALFLSEYTVARHLTHIFTKTGVENRAAAAAYALRHNVV